MNSIRRAITAERKRLLTLSPMSILQEQHASSSSTTRSTARTLKTSKTRAPEVRSQPARAPASAPSTTISSSNDAVRKEPVIWPKPSEIPWQAKVVNSVNLIGQVKIPVQFEASFDGKNWAGTIISQEDGSEPSNSLPSFWIPVIFEGDLAHIAMCHLREKDYVHIAGHLSVDVPPFKLSEVQANVQVMVHSINFVQGSPQSKKMITPSELDKWTIKSSAIPENNASARQSLKELDSMSKQLSVLSKRCSVDEAFEQENDGQLRNGAESSPVRNSKEVRHLHSDHKVDKQSIRASWRDLLADSKQWLDNRENKRKGLVKANYPDFKHKKTGVGLWLDKAPVEVLQGLGRLEFYVLPSKGEKEIPENNASSQQSLKEPDFMSKQLGVFSKRSSADVAFEQENDKQLLNGAESSPVRNSKEVWRLHSDHKVDKQGIDASWRDLLVNSNQWLDNRENKRKGLVKTNYPDFKHKQTGVGLWLNKAPAEVLRGLGQLEFYVLPSNGEKDGDSWKHLVKNPKKWWDNRLNKKNQKGPDFKNKDSGKVLWLGDAPAWALSSLPPLKADTDNVDKKKAWAS